MRGRVAAGVGVPGTPSSRWQCRPTASPLNKTPDAPLKMYGPTPPRPVVPSPRSAKPRRDKARTHLETPFEVIEAIQLPSEAGPLEIRQHFVAMFAASRRRRTALFCAQIAGSLAGRAPVSVDEAARRRQPKGRAHRTARPRSAAHWTAFVIAFDRQCERGRLR